METPALRHLVVVAGAAPAGGDAAGALAAACAKAVELAGAAFAAAPSLRAFSWAAPGVDRLLGPAPGPPGERAVTKAERTLVQAAAALGAELRICGRGASPPAGAQAARRTLVWLRHYSGRDEIVRAAARFFAANPGRSLGDGDLDRWLDTAGLPDPDLLVFVGGPLQLHDTLLWQGSYAEIWHTPSAWGAFGAAELGGAVEDYHARHRRFGR